MAKIKTFEVLVDTLEVHTRRYEVMVTSQEEAEFSVLDMPDTLVFTDEYQRIATAQDAREMTLDGNSGFRIVEVWGIRNR